MDHTIEEVAKKLEELRRNPPARSKALEIEEDLGTGLEPSARDGVGLLNQNSQRSDNVAPN